MKTLEQLLKSKVFSLLVIILMCATFCLSAVTCGLVAADFGKKGQVAAATLLTWNAPSYEDVDQSEKVTLKPLIVKDTEGNEYRASIAVLDPEGDPVAVIGDSFNASIVGQYTVTYTVTFNGVSESKSSTFYAVDPDDSNDQGEPGGNDQGDPDEGGSSSTTEYKAGVMTSIGGGASDDPFTVSGNTVSVKKATVENDYKGVKWELSDWSNTKAPKMSIKISNNTSAALKAKFKLVTDTEPCYSYPDFELAAGESSSWVTVFSENNDFSSNGVTSITVIELYLITTATSGTLSIELTFPGSNAGGNNAGGNTDDDPGSSGGSTSAGQFIGAFSAPYYADLFTINGNQISFDYNGNGGSASYNMVKADITGYSSSYKYLTVRIENTGDTEIGVEVRFNFNPSGQNYFFQTIVGAGKTVFRGNNVDWLLTQGNRTGFKDVEIIINSGESAYKTNAKTGSFKITFEWSTELGKPVTG